MIVMVTVSDRETRPQNLDRARIRGAELSLTLDDLPLPGDVRSSLAGNLHWQDARDEGASPIYRDKQLTYHPPLQANVRCDLVRGTVQLTGAASYRAASYWGRSNLPQFRSLAQWNEDASLRCAVPHSPLIAALRVENLSDARVEDVRGFPLPGRSWFVEITWSAGAATGTDAGPAAGTTREKEE
jgi:iron complex outermembrane receptor protein